MCAVFVLEGNLVGESEFRHFLSTYLHHPLADIDAHNVLGMKFQESTDSEVASASSNVEYAIRAFSVLEQKVNGIVPPDFVYAKTEGMVQRVVRMGDVVKHQLHLLTFRPFFAVRLYLLLLVHTKELGMRN